MPKVTLDIFEQKKREVRAWIDGGMALSGIRTHSQLARRIGLSPSTFSRRYNHPETLTMEEKWKMERIIGGYGENEV